jgi:hypothetical protein
MNQERFDDLTCALASGRVSRGRMLKVLVDAEGKIASEVAVGAPAVLELARASRTGLRSEDW